MKRAAFVILPLLLMVSSVFGQNLNELLAQSDQYSLKEFKNEKALEKLMQADKLSPNNWEVLWRLSRTYVDIAEKMPAGNDAQKDAQLAKYQESYNYANRAVNAAPDKSVTYLRRAISNGRIALFHGVWTAKDLVKAVKSDIDKALSLNNGGSEVIATCNYVLARTHAKLSEKPKVFRWPLGLSWGNMDDALTLFAKAIEMRPAYRMFRLDYAKALITEEEYSKAKEQLVKIPSIPVYHQDDNNIAAEAKNLYESIKNK